MSPVFNLNFGYRVNKYLRADVSGQYRDIKMTDDFKPFKVKCVTAMANVYLDGTNYSPLTPYVTAGIGAGAINAEYKFSSKKKSFALTNMAFNVGAGMQFQIDHNIGIDLGYRYVDFGKLKADLSSILPNNTKVSKNLGAHEVSINILVLLT